MNMNSYEKHGKKSAFDSLDAKIIENKENTTNYVDSLNKKNMRFPQQLMHILAQKEFEGIISWVNKGKSFSIHQKDKLVEVLRLCYFQQTKFESFRRKLHRYGFKAIQQGAKNAAYYHKYFLRDHPSLCAKIKCTGQSCKLKAFKDEDKLKINDANSSRLSYSFSAGLNPKYDSQRARSIMIHSWLNGVPTEKHLDQSFEKPHVFQVAHDKCLVAHSTRSDGDNEIVGYSVEENISKLAPKKKIIKRMESFLKK